MTGVNEPGRLRAQLQQINQLVGQAIGCIVVNICQRIGGHVINWLLGPNELRCTGLLLSRC